MPSAGMSPQGERHRAFHLSYRRWACLCAAVADVALRITPVCRVGLPGPSNWSWPVLRSATEFRRTGVSVCGRNVGPPLIFLLLAGCSGPQSTLDPAGPSAASIHLLGMIMYAGAVAVTLLVIVLMLAPFVRRRARPVDSRLFIWGGGVVLPSLTLTALVPYVMTFGPETRASTGPDSLAIDITGYLYWWEISYRRHDGSGPVISANELRLPIGEPVELILASRDVIHSLWIPSLVGKLDMVPGRVNRMTIQADQPGIYRGQCAEFCGTQHALMAFDVVTMPRAAFDAWLVRLSEPVPEPRTPELREGMELFLGLGCGGCHTVRGLSESPLGPDLTQIGARR
jgi:cytochrome c oxidase subunit 2